MKTFLAALLVTLLGAGCGVADTATATATIAEARKQEMENARATQERIQQDIAAAQQAAQDRMRAIEEQSR